jgi:hypothetical protein
MGSAADPLVVRESCTRDADAAAPYADPTPAPEPGRASGVLAGDAIVDEAARTNVCDDDDDDEMDEDGADGAELLRACLRDSGASSESLDSFSDTSAVVRLRLRLAASRDLISSV